MKGAGPAWAAWRRECRATRCEWPFCTRQGREARVLLQGLDWTYYDWERRCEEHAPKEGDSGEGARSCIE